MKPCTTARTDDPAAALHYLEGPAIALETFDEEAAGAAATIRCSAVSAT